MLPYSAVHSGYQIEMAARIGGRVAEEVARYLPLS